MIEISVRAYTAINYKNLIYELPITVVKDKEDDISAELALLARIWMSFLLV